ncbi:unnamed protein product [Rotaria sordida]|uniref:Uncharacterized protein n=1 Tax=Rotaria sordida TaxID=392033 RepID=A0A818QY75_9BILA|nr:unnamed protein product [Rotaria sordida]CAF3552166.1 unnamed protein product [Rotaria sordida]CAF3648108.1 unnamed protein product [Rotaria sordida]
MFYENAEFQLASFHVKNQNNNALIDDKSYRNENIFLNNNHQYKQKQCIINIILIGDKNIGKSKLIKQFTQNIFQRKKSQNTSLNIMYKHHNQTNEQKLHLKFHHINLTYQNETNLISICSYADCLLLVYDINNQISFNHLIDRCLPLIQNYELKHICSYSLIGIKHKNSRQIHYSQ